MRFAPDPVLAGRHDLPHVANLPELAMLFLSLANWSPSLFRSARGTAPRPKPIRKRPSWRPGFEALEGRALPATAQLPPAVIAWDLAEQAVVVTADNPLANAPSGRAASNAPAKAAPKLPALNQRLLTWIGSHLGGRVGGGECTQLVAEALRENGGKFVDMTNWGTLQVTLKYAKPKGAKPDAKAPVVSVNGQKFDPKHPEITGIKPGDVVQYWLKGNPNPVHAGVVHTVDKNGWPEMLYEQHVGGERTVHDTKRNLKVYEHGATVKIYRPVTRAQPPAGKFEFSIVNKCSTTVDYAIRETPPQYPPLNDAPMGTLDTDNTADSYNTGSWKAGGPKYTVELVVTAVVNGVPATQVVPLTDGAGYEVVEDVNGIIVQPATVEPPPPPPPPFIPQPIIPPPVTFPPAPLPKPAPEKDREQLGFLWDVLSLTKNASQHVWISLQFGKGDDAVALLAKPDAGVGGTWGDVWGEILSARELIVAARILFDAARQAMAPEQGRLVDEGNAKVAEATPKIRRSEQVWAQLWSATFVRV